MNSYEPLSPEYPATDRGDCLSRLKVLAAQAKLKAQAQTSSSLNARSKTQTSHQQLTKQSSINSQESDTGRISTIQDHNYLQRQGSSTARNNSGQRDSSGSRTSVITRLIANKNTEQTSQPKHYSFIKTFAKNSSTLPNNTLQTNASQVSNAEPNTNNISNNNSKSETPRRSRISLHNYVRKEMPPSTIKHRPTPKNSPIRLSSSGIKSSSEKQLDVNVVTLLDQYKQLVQKKSSKQQQQEEVYQQTKRQIQPTPFKRLAQSKLQNEVNLYSSNKFQEAQSKPFNNPTLANVVSAAAKLLKLRTTADLSEYQFEKECNPPLQVVTSSHFKLKQTDFKKELPLKEGVNERKTLRKATSPLQPHSKTNSIIIQNPVPSDTTHNNTKNQQVTPDTKLSSNVTSQRRLSISKELAKMGSQKGSLISTVNISSSYMGSFLSKQLGISNNFSSSISQQESCSTERTSLDEEQTFINEMAKQPPQIDDFIFLKVLGKGSYAVVRSAAHKKTGFVVAIKSYDKSKFTDSQRKQNVEREIEILSHINHKHIIKLYKSIEDRECVNLVMEYTPCASLSGYLKSKSDKRMHEFEAKTIFRQLVEAVVYLHSKKIIHRDIKLENILIDSERQVKLIDFGFSTILAPPYRMTMFCGTPSYMAPEIVSKAGYSFEVDTWALGVLLYKLLTGSFPFAGEDDKTLYKSILKCKFDMPVYISIQGRTLLSFLLKENPMERMQLKDVLNDDWFEWK